METTKRKIKVRGRTGRAGRKFRISKLIPYIVLLGIVFITLLPLYYMAISAFKPLDELYIFPPKFTVDHPTVQNFLDFFRAVDTTAVPFSRNIFNSLFTSISSVIGTILVSTAGAYAISKLRLPGSGVIFSIIVAALMFSTHVTQIPTFLVVNQLKMIDTYWSLIIPKVAAAYNFFLVKQFCDQLPDSLLEAARIDGANEFVVYRKIIMPLLKPAIATVAMQSFVANWNDFFSPLIFINSQAMKPLTLMLQQIGSGGNLARAGAMAAATFMAVIPPLILFIVMQKRVTETMAFSGIKG